MQTHAKRWITVAVIALVVGIAWSAWRALHDISPLDIRAEAARAAAVAYGTVRDDTSGRTLTVEEIWKMPRAEAGLSVGSGIPLPQLPAKARPEHLIVFLESASPGGRLRAQTLIAVYHERLGDPDMSVEDAKAICAAAPSI